MWIIVALPLASVVIGVLLRWVVPARFGGGAESRLAGIVTVIAVALAWILSVTVFIRMIVEPGIGYTQWFTWLSFPEYLTDVLEGQVRYCCNGHWRIGLWQYD